MAVKVGSKCIHSTVKMRLLNDPMAHNNKDIKDYCYYFMGERRALPFPAWKAFFPRREPACLPACLSPLEPMLSEGELRSPPNAFPFGAEQLQPGRRRQREPRCKRQRPGHVSTTTPGAPIPGPAAGQPWTSPRGTGWYGIARGEPSLYTVKAIFIMDSFGQQLLAKYYDDTFPSTKEQKSFERNVFNKTHKTDSEIAFLEGLTIVYKSSIDLFFYVVGSPHENELMLTSVLSCLFESLNHMLRKNVEKRALMENLDGVFLVVDEIVDGGWMTHLYQSTVSLRSFSLPKSKLSGPY
ncbi:coatomer subunit zeta-2 isoform X2 [Anolis carolinensis]|uniref:coatomer subunit zeta-2 isoform X2 n=1 Tax=Anolis carolinensis TaxID=28377 RepID=UPI002F2B5577